MNKGKAPLLIAFILIAAGSFAIIAVGRGKAQDLKKALTGS